MEKENPATAPSDLAVSDGQNFGPNSVGPNADHEAREINEVVERLTERFPHEQPERIRGVVEAARHQFEGNPIRDFVPVFVERAAKAVLDRPLT